jgi:hypothetical protein
MEECVGREEKLFIEVSKDGFVSTEHYQKTTFHSRSVKIRLSRVVAGIKE